MNDDETALAEAAAELDAVQEVLGRLDDGSIDECQACGARIGTERLKADPLTTVCERHLERPVAVFADGEPFPLGAQQP